MARDGLQEICLHIGADCDGLSKCISPYYHASRKSIKESGTIRGVPLPVNRPKKPVGVRTRTSKRKAGQGKGTLLFDLLQQVEKKLESFGLRLVKEFKENCIDKHEQDVIYENFTVRLNFSAVRLIDIFKTIEI